MNCPKCFEPLRIAERQGVEIDYCPDCRGIWLDKGELDKIIDRTLQSEAAAPPPPPESYRKPDKKDKKDRDYDRDYDKYRHKHKKSKKKHILKEIIDLFD